MDKPVANDVLLKDAEQWLHFSEAHTIISAHAVHEVIPALRAVEALVARNGWHAAGFVSYEAASAFDAALQTSLPGSFPYLWFGLYSQPKQTSLPKTSQPREVVHWHPTVDQQSYQSAISQIKDYIAQGKTYQVNYTMRLEAPFKAEAWDFFLHLAQTQNEQAAYVDTGQYVICSASPELFFELDGEDITCRPMKGTAKRGRTTAEDLQQSDWLQHSEKNRAENVMIVDMIRNDLGRIAKLGSVHVPQLFVTERYPTLWQMTSTVKAQTNASLTEILCALFPCASITGAPKVSTMHIIHELETTPRKIYTGTVGYIAPTRRARFNVAIRTALIDRKKQSAEYGIGGGIVWDSTSTDEYAEALLKARVLAQPTPPFSLLETLLWRPAEGYFLCRRHVERLLDSAQYFGFSLSERAVEHHLARLASGLQTPQRVRLLVSQDGEIKTEAIPFQPVPKTIEVRLAAGPIHSEDIFLFHKTTKRDMYETARASVRECDDVLLWNERGELTECTIGNLVLELDGQLVTPPVQCGLLPGTFRAHLLETGQVVERVIPVERLKNCSQIFRVNSLRGWEKVHLLQG